MAEHYDLGIKGEHIAVDFLKGLGYNILKTNWRYLKAEIDIIARYKDKLIIVEVKTRSYDHLIHPQTSINKQKQKLLIYATNQYIIENDLDIETQFDIICIVKNKHKTKIEHIQNAFVPF